MGYFDSHTLIDELNAFKEGKVLRDTFFNRYYPLGRMKRTTYPGGKWITRGPEPLPPKYYVQTIPIKKSEVEFNLHGRHPTLSGEGAGEKKFWDFVEARISACIQMFRIRFQRHLTFPKIARDVLDESLQLTPFAYFTNHKDALQWKGTDYFDRDDWKAFCDALNEQSRSLESSPLGQKIGMTSVDVWDQLEGDLSPSNRFTDRRLSDLGVESLVIDNDGDVQSKRRSVPIIYDKHFDPKMREIHVLDFDALELCGHEDFDFKILDWVPGTEKSLEQLSGSGFNFEQRDMPNPPEDAGDFCYCLILFFGNIVCNQYANQGVYHIGGFR